MNTKEQKRKYKGAKTRIQGKVKLVRKSSANTKRIRIFEGKNALLKGFEVQRALGP
jgi:hypothetical protein